MVAQNHVFFKCAKTRVWDISMYVCLSVSLSKNSKNDLVANNHNDNYLYESVSDCFQIALLLLDRILSPCLKNLLQYIMFIKFWWIPPNTDVYPWKKKVKVMWILELLVFVKPSYKFIAIYNKYNRSLKRHMVSGSRCPIYLIRCLGYMVNRAAAPEGPMTYDSTQGSFEAWEGWFEAREGRFGAWEGWS